MRLHDPANLRRLVRHRCQYCGRDFFADRQTGRPRLFCDKKCKDGEFRRLRYLTFKNVETPQKNEVNSKISKVESGYRPPVEILGRGHRWSNSATIERETLVEIIESEIPERRIIRSAPPNPFVAEIDDDLSIPAFLRRRP